MEQEKLMRKIFALSTAVILAGFAVPSLAQFEGQAVQPQAQAALAFTDPASVPRDLANIDAALNNTLSFQGRFAQYGADGSFSCLLYTSDAADE